MTRIRLVLSLLLLAVLIPAWCNHAIGQDVSSKRFYLIGNSLTWDTIPSRLDGDVQWHVDCGVSLPHIYANPSKPCVKESTIWPKALSEKQYDVVSVQPHYGSTLEKDVQTISTWMKQQPNAVFIIHSGWAFHAQVVDEFASFSAPTEMIHSPGYVRSLIRELRRLHPGRELRQTFAQNLLAQIVDDIEAGQAPLDKLETLYRDRIHLTHEHGRYMAHNAMRRAMGQPRSAKGFPELEPKLKQYVDSVLSMLDTSPADKALLAKTLSADASNNRTKLIEGISDAGLRKRMKALLPSIEQATKTRRDSLKIAAEIEKIGGRVVWAPSGPQWLYLATGDTGMDIFDALVTVDLYNGNNPLKGRGGRNEQVTDDWLQRLSGVTSLRRLDLANCVIKGNGLKHIAGLTGLRELNLTLTPVTDDGLKHLSNLTELRMLGLASTQCNGTGFAHLKSLRKLESVNFHFTPLNDAGLQAISQVPISDRLWFAHTHFTDSGAKPLASLTKLKRCGIGSKAKGSTGEAVAALVDLPLEDLSLLDNQASDAGIAHAAKIRTLKRLDVSYGPTVTDDSLALIAAMPKLAEFRIGGACITDTGLMLLAKSESLKKLTINRSKKVTAEGIAALKKVRPKLVIESR